MTKREEDVGEWIRQELGRLASSVPDVTASDVELPAGVSGVRDLALVATDGAQSFAGRRSRNRRVLPLAVLAGGACATVAFVAFGRGADPESQGSIPPDTTTSASSPASLTEDQPSFSPATTASSSEEEQSGPDATTTTSPSDEEPPVSGATTTTSPSEGVEGPAVTAPPSVDPADVSFLAVRGDELVRYPLVGTSTEAVPLPPQVYGFANLVTLAGEIVVVRMGTAVHVTELPLGSSPWRTIEVNSSFVASPSDLLVSKYLAGSSLEWRRVSLRTLDDESLVGEFDAKWRVVAASPQAVVFSNRDPLELVIASGQERRQIANGFMLVGANDDAFIVSTAGPFLRCDWNANCSPTPLPPDLSLAESSVAESDDATSIAAIEISDDGYGGRIVVATVATGVVTELNLPFAPSGIHWLTNTQVMAYGESQALVADLLTGHHQVFDLSVPQPQLAFNAQQ